MSSGGMHSSCVPAAIRTDFHGEPAIDSGRETPRDRTAAPRSEIPQLDELVLGLVTLILRRT